MKKYILFKLTFLFTINCVGVGGDKVLNEDSFRENLSDYLTMKYVLCQKELEEKSASSLLAVIANTSRNLSVLFGFQPVKYISKKDQDFCFQSIIFSDCESVIVNELLYCRPERTCLNSNEHPGQGSWCIK